MTSCRLWQRKTSGQRYKQNETKNLLCKNSMSISTKTSDRKIFFQPRFFAFSLKINRLVSVPSFSLFPSSFPSELASFESHSFLFFDTSSSSTLGELREKSARTYWKVIQVISWYTEIYKNRTQKRSWKGCHGYASVNADSLPISKTQHQPLHK